MITITDMFTMAIITIVMTTISPGLNRQTYTEK